MLELQRIGLAQLGIPVRLQGAGHQPVSRIDQHVAPTCEFGFVADALQLRAAQHLGLFDALRNLMLHGQCHLDCGRRDRLQQQLGHRSVNGRATDPLARVAAGVPHDGLVAHVVRLQLAGARFVVHTHALAATPAQHAPLQQGGALARHLTARAGREAAGVAAQRALVTLELGPVDVALVRLGDQHLPGILGYALLHPFEPRVEAHATATVSECAGVARVVQQLHDPAVVDQAPQQISLANAAAQPTREQQLLGAKAAHDRGRRAGLAEGIEHQPHRGLDLLVGVEHRAAFAVVDQTDRQRHLELAASGLVQDAALQARLEHVQFGLAHRAL